MVVLGVRRTGKRGVVHDAIDDHVYNRMLFSMRTQKQDGGLAIRPREAPQRLLAPEVVQRTAIGAQLCAPCGLALQRCRTLHSQSYIGLEHIATQTRSSVRPVASLCTGGASLSAMCTAFGCSSRSNAQEGEVVHHPASDWLM
jgi:hypothetical protein